MTTRGKDTAYSPVTHREVNNFPDRIRADLNRIQLRKPHYADSSKAGYLVGGVSLTSTLIVHCANRNRESCTNILFHMYTVLLAARSQTELAIREFA